MRGLAGAHEANVSLVPSASSLSLDADTLAAGGAGVAGGLLAADPEGAQALGELPGESWLAIGLGHVGATLGEDTQELQGLTSLGSTLGGGAPESTAGLSISGLVGGLIAPLRVLGANTAQARRDFASWMGSAGIFASGANLLELKGAVVIASKRPAASRAAVAELAAQLRKAGASISSASIPGTEAAVGARVSGLPVVLDIADGRDAAGQTKFVLGIGEASVAAALDPSSTLAAAAPRTAAAAALGEGTQPSMIVELPDLPHAARRHRAQRRPVDLQARPLPALSHHARRRRRRSSAAASTASGSSSACRPTVRKPFSGATVPAG